jgi:predicted DCC family thiol-disulfide oxidoreductase YuxK
VDKNQTKVVLFDFSCGFCSSIVIFLKNADKKNKIQFVPIQSKEAEVFFREYSVSIKDIDTIYFFSGKNMFVRSDAVFHILKEIGGWLKPFYIGIVIPRPLRDWMYTIIARHRHLLIHKKGGGVCDN